MIGDVYINSYDIVYIELEDDKYLGLYLRLTQTPEDPQMRVHEKQHIPESPPWKHIGNMFNIFKEALIDRSYT